MAPNDRTPAPLSDRELDALLADLRAEDTAPSAEFLARVEARALQEMPRQVSRIDAPAAPAPGRLRRWLSQIGGLSGLAGLAAAGIAGLFIGYLDSDIAGQMAGLVGFELTSYDVTDLYAGTALFDEGI